jgi:ADP-heptose:LPS heptosyltransferase
LRKKLSLVGFDLSIDLSCDYPMRKGFLSYLSNSAFRVGYDLYGRGLFFNCPLPSPVQRIHTIDKVLNLLTFFGVEISGCRPEPLVQERWKEEFQQILMEPETGRKQRIAIHPGGTYQTQRWSEERFSEIGDRIHKVFGFPPLLLGGPGDKQRAGTICEKMVSKPIDLTWKLSFGAMAAAISSSRLLVCNNSGPLHMAVATGTPTISVMGPTVPEAWWPRGEIHRVIRKKIACSPCNEGFCHVGTHECLRSISVEEMWREVILQMEQG